MASASANENPARELPKVFTYLDHRLFLRDWFEAKKALNHGYSYRVFARRAGFSSHAFLSEVMHGRRNLSEDSIEKFLKALNLSGAEEDYFRVLVHYGQEERPEPREELLEVLIRTQAGLATGQVGRRQEAYFSHWIHAVVRELAVQLPEASAEDIAALLSPTATAGEVKNSLSLLEELGLIEQKNGRREYGLSARLTPSNIPESIIQALKRQYFLLVQDRIIAQDADVHASSVILSVSRRRMELIQEKLDQLRREILAASADDSDPLDRVVLINFQMVPLTQKVPKKA